jgi:hypothetical protein
MLLTFLCLETVRGPNMSSYARCRCSIRNLAETKFPSTIYPKATMTFQKAAAVLDRSNNRFLQES